MSESLKRVSRERKSLSVALGVAAAALSLGVGTANAANRQNTVSHATERTAERHDAKSWQKAAHLERRIEQGKRVDFDPAHIAYWKGASSGFEVEYKTEEPLTANVAGHLRYFGVGQVADKITVVPLPEHVVLGDSPYSVTEPSADYPWGEPQTIKTHRAVLELDTISGLPSAEIQYDNGQTIEPVPIAHTSRYQTNTLVA